MPIPEIYPIIYPIFQTIWAIIKVWWWLPLPFIFFKKWKYHYLKFIQERWYSNIKNILIEVKIPKEVNKSIKAMEHVFAGLHGVFHSPPNWREKWIDGEFQLSLTLEIVSLEGKIHFYIRIPEMYRQLVESTIYSQYPGAEISLADNYIKQVPQDIPNKDWNIFGLNFINVKDESYPIKTYQEFEMGQEKNEEKKVEPLSVLLESLSFLGQNEHMWIQIKIKPVHGYEHPWIGKGKKLVDKLAKRPEKVKSKSILQEFWEALNNVIFGPILKSESKPKQGVFAFEILTPGERQVIAAVEKKIGKFGFDSFIRFLYIAKKDVFFKPKVKAIFSFFKDISTENLGGFKPLSSTLTKVKTTHLWFLDKRRVYLRQRKIFRHYCNRVSPFYPKPGGTFILNTEELATLFHFPSEGDISTLALSRVETKTKEAPSNLPVE
jgi:hypothetical protein